MVPAIPSNLPGQVRRDGKYGQLLSAATILQETSCALASRGCPASGSHMTLPSKKIIKHVEKRNLRMELRAVGWSLWERELGVFFKDRS